MCLDRSNRHLMMGCEILQKKYRSVISTPYINGRSNAHFDIETDASGYKDVASRGNHTPDNEVCTIYSDSDSDQLY